MFSRERSTGAALGRPTQTPARKVALIAGLLFLITFVAAIAGVILYAPVLHPAKYIVGAGADTRVRLGAFCELILIIANIGSAVVTLRQKAAGRMPARS
jgi:hypothetical protein